MIGLAGATCATSGRWSARKGFGPYDALAHDNDPVRAVRRVPPQPQPDLSSYRGRMLTPDQSRLLYEALAVKGLRPLNDPAAYRHCPCLELGDAQVAGLPEDADVDDFYKVLRERWPAEA